MFFTKLQSWHRPNAYRCLPTLYDFSHTYINKAESENTFSTPQQNDFTPVSLNFPPVSGIALTGLLVYPIFVSLSLSPKSMQLVLVHQLFLNSVVVARELCMCVCVCVSLFLPCPFYYDTNKDRIEGGEIYSGKMERKTTCCCS